MEEKKCVTLGIIGHYFSGKSSLSSLMAYYSQLKLKLSFTFNRKFSCINSFDITIEIHQFRRKNYHLNLKYTELRYFDSPGFPNLKNELIKTISQSDNCFIFVSALKEEYELNRGNLQQIEDQIILTKVFGVKKIFFIISKMDEKEVNFEQEKFEDTVKQISMILQKLNENSFKYQFIPISSYKVIMLQILHRK